MAASVRPTTQYFGSDFVISAGSILFRKASETGHIQICILWQRRKHEWLLPKGRKDRGESIEVAAVRETFEETGYPCEILPCNMPTRAPVAHVDATDVVRIADDAIEPFAVTVRDLGRKGVKFIWWYLTRVIGEKREGTQMASEAFDSYFFDAEEAIAKLTFQKDRDVVSKALGLVRDSGTNL
ncbi:hypothetical protein SERLA73DRAFT_189250 [Serpula lacrymans var. lacrymans S7.3]|uniref:Nudix hydrolase domain-containing protein n=2 Tax=Serpula lacrymans var. lacrymans TaxID=341189 RepID=F8QD72_SERL3|nr:uncharacterized protein SERLADRAFT_479980 [Serpula lacrymans var. lacrymans S7.9]EGN93543.1 hypothetical protein SERLA73DRAFT_189250 [Serpula lacrymans var. lacrymans S7.3]EGO18920.1 hypothetical protein SERLADRAFT_479980 [Serpula lacrymans var. lacrymans S7.9]